MDIDFSSNLRKVYNAGLRENNPQTVYILDVKLQIIGDKSSKSLQCVDAISGHEKNFDSKVRNE